MEIEDRLIAGGAADFMALRHLRLRGSQNEIGQHLARVARDDLGVRKQAWTSPRSTRAQRFFLRRNWPSHFDRMRGVAATFGADLEDDRLDFSFLAYDMGVPGCSCVFFPAERTADRHSVLGRNFDYTTGGYAELPIGNDALKDIVQRGEELGTDQTSVGRSCWRYIRTAATQHSACALATCLAC